jgi:hypothetical protein
MTGRRWIILWGLLGLTMAGSRAVGQARPRIRVLIPKLEGAVGAQQVTGAYEQLVAQVRQIFPCGDFLTDREGQARIDQERDSVMRGQRDSDPTELLSEIERADYVINFTFSATGTRYRDPGRVLRFTMWVPRRFRVTTSGVSSGAGWNWDSSDLVSGILDPFLEVAYDVCPWVGTIVYKRTVDSTARATIRSVEGTGIGGIVVKDGDPTSTTVHTDTYKSHEEEEWTFTLARLPHGPGFKTTGDGRAAMTSDAEQLAVATNKTCFAQAADGSVSDSRIVRGANDEIKDHQTVNGRAAGPLLTPRVRVERADSGGSWTIIVEGTASGSGAGKGTHSRRGGCGNWSNDDPTQTGAAPYGRLLAFTLDPVPDNRTMLSGKFTDVDGLGGEVTLALTRK